MEASQFLNATMKELMESCGIDSHNLTSSYKNFILDIVIILLGCRILHMIFHHYHQPRIISEFIMALLVANTRILKIEEQVRQAFQPLETIASATYMFVLGLEMEPRSIIRSPGQESNIAYSGIITTIFLVIVALLPFRSNLKSLPSQNPHAAITFSVMFAATSSPIVTRLTTELKLSKSNIGRRAIRASLANDMLCTLLICFLSAFSGKQGNTLATHFQVMLTLIYVVVELMLIVVVVRPVYRYVNDQNPEGRPLNGIHMVMTIALTQLLCYSSLLFDYDVKPNSFLIGLALPREGRVSNYLISKVNYSLTTYILPLYLSMANLKLSGRKGLKHSVFVSWVELMFVVVIITFGKMSGTLIAGWYYGLHWLESVTLGVLLNMKGYLQVFFLFYSNKIGNTDNDSVLVILFGIMLTIVVAPPTVSYIVKRARLKGAAPQLMGLQWHNPLSELKIMVGIQNPQNVPASMTLVEMLRGSSQVNGQLSVHVVDMIPLTYQAEASLIYRQGTDAVTVIDPKVVALREQIGSALDAYRDGKLMLKRTLAVSTMEDMHEDVCCGSHDVGAVMILLPFHRRKLIDGRMDGGDSAFRTVNVNVLERASCSVGILVDRGLVSLTNSSMNVAVVFIGGADDREALAYAGYVARHPGVRMMVIRFLPDKEAMMMGAGMGRRILTSVTDEEKEMKVDDDYFAVFYGEFIESKGVGYMEKHVVSGAQVVSTLKGLEAGYQLFVVGRGREQDSVLTAGMMDWADCPELGAIGDVLAASDFSSTASVLVIQQHDCSRYPHKLENDFMPSKLESTLMLLSSIPIAALITSK